MVTAKALTLNAFTDRKGTITDAGSAIAECAAAAVFRPATFGGKKDRYQMRPRHFPPTPQEHARKRTIFGIAIAGVGLVILLRMLNILPPFEWSLRLGWPMILIAIGLAIGVKSGFRNHAWWILLLLGGVHLLPSFDIAPGVPARRVIWPAMLIIAGLLIVLRRNRYPSFSGPGRHSWAPHAGAADAEAVVTNGEDVVDIDVLFSGRKEYVTSRNLRGGRVSATFSGVELNLTGADAVAPMMLDVRINFASLELIVPAHWEVQNEIAPTMGSVDDQRRTIMPTGGTERKLLILRGTCTFGSVEIKSY